MDSDDDMQYDNDDSYLEDDEDEDEEKSNDQILDHTSLELEMANTISDVESVLQIKPGVCRILLHKYKWNKESVYERFYEHPDTNTFLIDAQIIPKQSEVVTSSEDSDECDICCSSDELSGLECNHHACSECWKSYLTTKIMEDGQSEIECMASDCKLLIEDEKIMSYITDSSVIAKYRRLTLDSYVETNRLLKWCPGVDCGKAVKVTHSECRLVTCSCGCRFCFSCGNDWHEPVNCQLLKLWLKRCMDDSETCNWINANTKDCPKCFTAIEKDGGCNYMRCSTCKQGFCWHCLGPHDHNMAAHKCKNFEDSDANKKKNESRISLQRYLFYYTRYMGHQKSLQLEEKLNSTVRDKMQQMEQMNMSWSEVQYLSKAVAVLSECRRTLMFTYVFAFYLEKTNASLIFEGNQNDLETATEQLSGFLEQDLDKQNDLITLKQNVQDKCRYVEKRRKILLDHCSEGTEQDIWEFNDGITTKKKEEVDEMKPIVILKRRGRPPGVANGRGGKRRRN